MQIIGHRGAMGYKPENTLSSFEEALRLGVNGIELDVWVCMSGELVVFHDEVVNNLTNGTGKITQKTLAELKKLKVNHPRPELGEELPHGIVTIPTLEEVLDLVDKTALVNIELKGTRTAEPVYEMLRYYVGHRGWYFQQFLVSSFDHPELKKFQRISRENVDTGYLFSAIPLGGARYFENAGAYAIHPEWDTLNQRLVDDAHKRGLKVNVWTISDEERARKVLPMGVDGIFVNDPVKAKEWVAKYATKNRI